MKAAQDRGRPKILAVDFDDDLYSERVHGILSTSHFIIITEHFLSYHTSSISWVQELGVALSEDSVEGATTGSDHSS